MVSHIQVHDFVRMLDDEFPPGFDIVSHQGGEELVGEHRVGDADPLQHTLLGIHGGLPQLLGVHLSQSLVPADVGTRHLGEVLLHLLVIVGVLLGLSLVHPVEGRHGEVDVSFLDEGPHLPVEQGEEQGGDVGSVHRRRWSGS